jgi:hypothetical protein
MSKLTGLSLAVLLGLAAVCLGLAAAVPAHADEPSKPDVTAAGETLMVFNSVSVMRFRVSAGGYTPEQRFVIANDRVIAATMISDAHKAFHVYTMMLHGEPSIYIDGRLIVTVTPGDAAANHCSPSVLAGVWCDNLSRAVSSQQR